MSKTLSVLLPLLVMMMLLIASNARAADEEMLLAQSNLHLDYKAEKTGWPTVVFDQLRREFNVSEAMIYSLRERNLSYSEISAVLALAEQLPGGINDQNVDHIIRLRRSGHGDSGWGSVAKTLRVSLSRVIDHARTIGETSWAQNTELAKNKLDVKGNADPWSDSDRAHPLQSIPRLDDALRPGH